MLLDDYTEEVHTEDMNPVIERREKMNMLRRRLFHSKSLDLTLKPTRRIKPVSQAQIDLGNSKYIENHGQTQIVLQQRTRHGQPCGKFLILDAIEIAEVRQNMPQIITAMESAVKLTRGEEVRVHIVNGLYFTAWVLENYKILYALRRFRQDDADFTILHPNKARLNLWRENLMALKECFENGDFERKFKHIASSTGCDHNSQIQRANCEFCAIMMSSYNLNFPQDSSIL